MTDPFAAPTPGSPVPPPTPAPYGEPLRGPMRNGLGTAALILGVLSFCLGMVLIVPILAIVFGIVGMRRAERGEASNKGVALAGAITGGIGLVLGLLLIVGAVRLFQSEAFDRFEACDRAATTQEQTDTCIEELMEDWLGVEG